MFLKNFILFIIFFILIFILNIENSDAKKIKINWWWTSYSWNKIYFKWVDLFKNNYWSNYISNSDINELKCLNLNSSFNYDSEIFLVSSTFLYPNSEFKLEELKQDIENTYVNKYDSGSVNYYNSKVNEFNRMIKENNIHLEREWIPLTEYCKPYVCSKKYPGSIYNKETNTCDNEEYSHPYDTCEIWKCKLWNNCFLRPENAVCIANDKNNAWKCKLWFEEKNWNCLKIEENEENLWNILNENDVFLDKNSTWRVMLWWNIKKR